ncbi:MAG: glycosyltransferase [Bacteroidetes bacterium]|nr:glycosyltransferase [Bacteroidota bacterium]
MNKDFVNQVREFKPAVVLVFKGMEISKRSLMKIKTMGVKLANYNFDHPFIHFSRGTGNRFVTEAIPYYDLHISYSSLIAKQLLERYQVQTAVIPFGFHITEEQFANVILEDVPEINEVCFVGNPDSIRIAALQKLINEKIKINVYGFGWESYLKPSDWLTIHKHRRQGTFWEDQLEFWKVIRQYRIQLNFFRPHNEGSHNLRTFEVPSVGGILLTPDSMEQRSFFENERELFFYSDETGMIRQCKRLLAMEGKEINKIRNSARKKSIEQDYSYKRRTADLVALLKNLLIK